MKMLSDCSGECCVCALAGFCLAGHGDDDFIEATEKQIRERLESGKYEHHREYMIEWIRNKYR